MATEMTESYLLIGAGCFGASTALYLKQHQPEARVTLVDRMPFPSPIAAAHDLNKIVRSEYTDLVYMRLALEALSIWRDDSLYNPFFHETGILFAGIAAPGVEIIENYDKLRGTSTAELIEPEEAKKRFDGIFRDAEWSKVESCIWNPCAGWCEAENALAKVVESAVQVGVEYVTASVSKLRFNGDGSCVGAETDDGKLYSAERTILCVGAYTAKLIADSAPDWPELQVDARLVAAAAVMGAFRVPAEELDKFNNAPIIVNPMGGKPGESIPVGPPGLLKCTHELSFTNKMYHEASKQTISVPPAKISQSTWSQEVPESLKAETEVVERNIYGNWINDLKPEYFRMCWDAVTPNQDFVICPHPASKRLFIASGGSFHSWKFMTNIGKYVVQMMDGTLEESLMKKWGWDREDKGAANPIYQPSRDLGDIIKPGKTVNGTRTE